MGQFNIAEDICSMTEFKRRTTAFVARLRGTGRALVLTTNGRPDVVVQDAASYQKLLDQLRAYEAGDARGTAIEKGAAAGRG
jgi:prevent-host-death family protein